MPNFFSDNDEINSGISAMRTVGMLVTEIVMKPLTLTATLDEVLKLADEYIGMNCYFLENEFPPLAGHFWMTVEEQYEIEMNGKVVDATSWIPLMNEVRRRIKDKIAGGNKDISMVSEIVAGITLNGNREQDLLIDNFNDEFEFLLLEDSSHD